jgi:hypothetical protein
VITTSRFGPINTRTPLNQVEIKFEDSSLAENEFGHRHQRGLDSFSEKRPASSEEEVLHELLGKSGGAAHAIAIQIVFRGGLYFVPIKPMMLVEPRILRGDDRML